MISVEALSPDEKRAFDLVTDRDGILQSELWKALDVDSRKGSRIARSLEEKGLVEREQTTNDGQRTYLLTPTNDGASATSGAGNEPTAEATDEEAGELTDREERALSLIRERGGLYQSELWKELDVSSRTGSRIASSLETKAVIRREEATYDGQRTYFLEPMDTAPDFSLLMAGDTMSPFVGTDEEIDPIESEEFTQWILQLARDER